MQRQREREIGRELFGKEIESVNAWQAHWAVTVVVSLVVADRDVMIGVGLRR